MYCFKKSFIIYFLCLCAAFICIQPTLAQAEAIVAQDITSSIHFSGDAYNNFSFLADKNINNYQTASTNGQISIESSTNIGSLYMLFNFEYNSYTITDNETGNIVEAGKHSFLHEYVDLIYLFGKTVKSLTISFSGDHISMSEIYVFSPGAAPDFVQKWNAPLDKKADIILFTTHADDDQLFFAGLLPLYAGARHYDVQVVYMTDHRNLTTARTHELLNGLWAVGVKAYPVWGNYADFRIDDMEKTYQRYESYNVSREDLLKFVVTQIRRFRPQVAIGHDINGEYGHGMHMVYTDLLIKALDVSNNPSVFPDLVEDYGTWDVPKTYLHLYENNQIILNYDEPLPEWDGMTAFQVSQKLGYPCHKSQQYTWFTKWINGANNEITQTSQIATYNPSLFGLYRSLVGEDVAKNDIMENIVSYAEQARIAEEKRLEEERRKEQERLEQERLEQERLEQERLEEEKRKQEEERREQEEEQKRIEAEKAAQEALHQQLEQEKAAQAQRKKQLLVFCSCLFVIIIVLLIIIVRLSNRISHKKK